ncbi:hypothetical protein BDV32DRAFT_43875 [Aspergillus pseudonomiae]|nr:hypothetical protein BDV32DRAFT_43875 [Aspergillus pseudonomiae]
MINIFVAFILSSNKKYAFAYWGGSKLYTPVQPKFEMHWHVPTQGGFGWAELYTSRPLSLPVIDWVGIPTQAPIHLVGNGPATAVVEACSLHAYIEEDVVHEGVVRWLVELPRLDRADGANNNKDMTNYVDSVNSSFTVLFSRTGQVPSKHTHRHPHLND